MNREIVRAEAYERVLEIRTSAGTGTAFTIDEGARQYLVTAKHLLAPSETQPRVALSNRFGRSEIELDLLDVSPDAADVAVAPLDQPLTPALDLPASAVGLIYSQPVFFLGFPYGMALEVAASERLAFVKGGLISASAEVDGVRLWYIDGLGNPGFSGGPVVASIDGTMHVVGVITGWRDERQPVYVGTTPVEGVDVWTNTGIVTATDIGHAVRAIERSPGDTGEG